MPTPTSKFWRRTGRSGNRGVARTELRSPGAPGQRSRQRFSAQRARHAARLRALVFDEVAAQEISLELEKPSRHGAVPGFAIKLRSEKQQPPNSLIPISKSRVRR
jgi:hypothetical protein